MTDKPKRTVFETVASIVCGIALVGSAALLALVAKANDKETRERKR